MGYNIVNINSADAYPYGPEGPQILPANYFDSSAPGNKPPPNSAAKISPFQAQYMSASDPGGHYDAQQGLWVFSGNPMGTPATFNDPNDKGMLADMPGLSVLGLAAGAYGMGLTGTGEAAVGGGFGGGAAGGGGAALDGSVITGEAARNIANADLLASARAAADPIEALTKLTEMTGANTATEAAAKLGFSSTESMLSAVNPAWVKGGADILSSLNKFITPSNLMDAAKLGIGAAGVIGGIQAGNRASDINDKQTQMAMQLYDDYNRVYAPVRGQVANWVLHPGDIPTDPRYVDDAVARQKVADESQINSTRRAIEDRAGAGTPQAAAAERAARTAAAATEGSTANQAALQSKQLTQQNANAFLNLGQSQLGTGTTILNNAGTNASSIANTNATNAAQALYTLGRSTTPNATNPVTGAPVTSGGGSALPTYGTNSNSGLMTTTPDAGSYDPRNGGQFEAGAWRDGGAVHMANGGTAANGAIHGPGTGTSDSIPTRVPEGAYIVPADVVRHLGEAYFDKLVHPAERNMAIGRSVPIKASNGERVIPPSTVNRLGVKFFDGLREKHHKFVGGPGNADGGSPRIALPASIEAAIRSAMPHRFA